MKDYDDLPFKVERWSEGGFHRMLKREGRTRVRIEVDVELAVACDSLRAEYPDK